MSTTTAVEAGKIQPRLKQKYNTEIKQQLQDEFGYPNVMQIPGLVKVVVNTGVGEAARDSKVIDGAVEDLTRRNDDEGPATAYRPHRPQLSAPALPACPVPSG